jgi:hypothetical protein
MMLSAVAAFLNDIGIPARAGKVHDSFLPHVRISKGEIVYDTQADVSDLLHEAGHVALIPAKYRHLCDGDMDASMETIFENSHAAGEMAADSPTARALIQASESEATAWAWAAGKYLGLPEAEIITDNPDHYNGEGPEIRAMLAARAHFGINGLRAAGMIDSVKQFPTLNRWRQP